MPLMTLGNSNDVKWIPLKNPTSLFQAPISEKFALSEVRAYLAITYYPASWNLVQVNKDLTKDDLSEIDSEHPFIA